MNDDKWTDEDDAAVAAEALPGWHPSLFLDVLRSGLEGGGDYEKILPAFVTPESLATWGDFGVLREFLAQPLKISMNPSYGRDAPDVVYVRLVRDPGTWIVEDRSNVELVAVATLVWRPEIAIVPNTGWRLHHIGDGIDPAALPRTAHGFDPRTLG